jgi:hypothetical protein
MGEIRSVQMAEERTGMKNLSITVLITAFVLALTASQASASSITFAQTFQVGSANQFSIFQNIGGTTTVTAAGQDLFIFQVPTIFGSTPQVATFNFTATTAQTGGCGSLTCPNSDSFTQQGYAGTFSYIGAGNVNFLSGTFAFDATPTNSGGKFSSTIGGGGGSFAGTQTSGNPSGITLTSDILNFSGVTNETGGWTMSSLTPNFAVDATATTLSLPHAGQTFTAAFSSTFSSEGAPSSAPEPATLALMGSALLGLGLIGRKRFSR